MNRKTALNLKPSGLSGKAARRLISIGLVVVMALIFSLTSDTFLTGRNLGRLMNDAAYLGLIAAGMSFVIIGGGIDLSAGGIVCLVGILCSRLSFTGMPGILVALAGILIGALCGLVNAAFITRVKLTEFVATLASGFVFSGLGLIFGFRSGGTLISKGITNKSFLAIGGKIGDDIYHIAIVWVVLTVIMYLVLRKTNFGLHTYAIGSHSRSAQMSGVNTKRVKALGYIICGAFAGLAAVMVVADMGSSPANLGTAYEFKAIAACVVGGVVLGGGKGDAVSAFIGSLFMMMMMNGLYKYGLSTSWEYILQGAIILAATAFDSQFIKIMAKRLTARPH